MRVCAVIPAYNEAATIGEVVRRALGQVGTVLVVDDGSRDGTGDAARAAGAEVLVHDPNRGKGASLRDGFDWACARGFDAAVALDADGQHLPEEIGRFVAVAGQADLAVGNRMAERADMPFVRWQTNRIMSGIVSWLAGARIPDSQCGFRLVSAEAWQRLDIQTSNFDFESEMLVSAGRKGLRIVAVPISTVYAGEQSKINPVTDTVRFFRMVWRLWRKGGGNAHG